MFPLHWKVHVAEAGMVSGPVVVDADVVVFVQFSLELRSVFQACFLQQPVQPQQVESLVLNRRAV